MWRISVSRGVTPAAAAKGQYPLPEGSNFFWDTMKAAPPAVLPAMGPQLVTLTNLDLTGKARDGREVHVTIQDDPFGQGCVVDCHGDEALARALAPRIADRLAHPLHKHDSPRRPRGLDGLPSTRRPPPLMPRPASSTRPSSGRAERPTLTPRTRTSSLAARSSGKRAEGLPARRARSNESPVLARGRGS